jgi:hypothetical protein
MQRKQEFAGHRFRCVSERLKVLYDPSKIAPCYAQGDRLGENQESCNS